MLRRRGRLPRDVRGTKLDGNGSRGGRLGRISCQPRIAWGCHHFVPLTFALHRRPLDGERERELLGLRLVGRVGLQFGIEKGSRSTVTTAAAWPASTASLPCSVPAWPSLSASGTAAVMSASDPGHLDVTAAGGDLTGCGIGLIEAEQGVLQTLNEQGRGGDVCGYSCG